MWFLWDIFINGVEYFLIFDIFKRKLGLGEGYVKPAVLAALGLVATQSYLNLCGLPSYILVLVMSALVLVYELLLFQGTPGMRLLLGCLCECMLALANQIVTLIVVHMAFEELNDLLVPGLSRFVPTALYCGLVVVFFLLARLLPKNNYELPRNLQLLIGGTSIILTALSSLLQTWTHFVEPVPQAVQAYDIFFLGYLVLSGTVLISFWFLAYYYHHNTVLELERQNALWQIKSTTILQKTAREHIHDERTHLAMLYTYSDQGDLEGLRNYLQEMSSDLKQLDAFYNWTQNSAIDAALCTKLQAATEAGIPLKIKADTVLYNPLSDLDTAALIGNLLDNALEACLACIDDGVNNVSIQVEICVKRAFLLLTVQNTSTGHYKEHEGNLISTKKEPGHGFGIERIESAVEKVGGFALFQPLPGQFIADIAIPLESTKPKRH